MSFMGYAIALQSSLFLVQDQDAVAPRRSAYRYSVPEFGKKWVLQ